MNLPDRERLIKDVISFLQREHGMPPEAILASFSGGVAIPVTLLQHGTLGPLEAIVKHLREERLLRPVQIARLLGRDPRMIQMTYARAVRKEPGKLRIVPTPYAFPVQALQDRSLSVLEHIVLYLRSAHGLSQAEIGRVIARDPRTVGTVMRRARTRQETLDGD